MANRSFRARPLDVNRQLELVQDVDLLDSQEGLPSREVVHNHAQLDADNEKVGGKCDGCCCLRPPACCLLLRAVACAAAAV